MIVNGGTKTELLLCDKGGLDDPQNHNFITISINGPKDSDPVVTITQKLGGFISFRASEFGSLVDIVNGQIRFYLGTVQEEFQKPEPEKEQVREALEATLDQMSFLACCCRSGETLSDEDESQLSDVGLKAKQALALVIEKPQEEEEI